MGSEKKRQFLYGNLRCQGKCCRFLSQSQPGLGYKYDQKTKSKRHNGVFPKTETGSSRAEQRDTRVDGELRSVQVGSGTEASRQAHPTAGIPCNSITGCHVPWSCLLDAT